LCQKLQGDCPASQGVLDVRLCVPDKSICLVGVGIGCMMAGDSTEGGEKQGMISAERLAQNGRTSQRPLNRVPGAFGPNDILDFSVLFTFHRRMGISCAGLWQETAVTFKLADFCLVIPCPCLPGFTQLAD